MRGEVLRLLEKNEGRYKALIIHKLRLRGTRADLCGWCGVRDAVDEVFNTLIDDVLTRIREGTFPSAPDLHHEIRKRIDSHVSSARNRLRTRERIVRTILKPEAEGNLVYLNLSPEGHLLQKDFVAFVVTHDARLDAPVRAVLDGYTRPIDLSAALGVERTKADFMIRRLRKLLTMYLRGDDPPLRVRSPK